MSVYKVAVVSKTTPPPKPLVVAVYDYCFYDSGVVYTTALPKQVKTSTGIWDYSTYGGATYS